MNYRIKISRQRQVSLHIYPLFVRNLRQLNTMPAPEQHNGHDFLLESGDILKTIYNVTQREKLGNGSEIKGRVTNFFHPKELKEKLDLTCTEEGVKTEEGIKKIAEQLVTYSVRTQNRHFYNQLYGGIDEAGLASAWLMETINTNSYTYEVGPVFVLIEQFMIKELITLFGWEKGDGIFAPGGSMANMYGITCARQKKYPDLKKTGLFGHKPMVIITSDMSHYSIHKGSAFMGYGTDQVYSVKSNAIGQMTAESVRSAIKDIRANGKEPIFVNATGGTTVFGAFDPIDEIADVCQEEGVWLHVDACWGGTAIYSKQHKHLLKGIERVDSLSWNGHKMMSVPLQCSVFLLQHEGLLSEANKYGASYLYQKDKFYDISYDTGDKSLQCGRKGDALKLWMTIKINGLTEIENRVDVSMKAARYLESCVKRRKNFELVLPNPQFTNICFWYIPSSLIDEPRGPGWWKKLHTVAPSIKRKLLSAGTLQVGYQPIESKDLVNFFRMVVTNYPKSTEEDMDFVLDEIERHGKDITF